MKRTRTSGGLPGCLRAKLRNRATLLALFALAAGTLYAGLLPLWEGFDEAFHFGYVELLTCNPSTLPVMRTTTLPSSVVESFRLAPHSLAVERNIPGILTYDQHLNLTADGRAALHQNLSKLRTTCAFSRSPNYEAHQAPLAYWILAAAGTLLPDSLPVRVLGLRLVATILAIAVTMFAVHLLSPNPSQVLFWIFCSQMYWATVAHVSNDWLAVPLVMLVFGLLARFADNPSRWTAAHLALALTAGLLTKAYFIALAAAAIVVALRRGYRALPILTLIPAVGAGWWYIRNIRLYGNLTGMQESLRGTHLPDVIHAAFQIPWPAHIAHMAHAALWTGNNSFTTFSGITLNLALLVLFTGLALHIVNSPPGPADHAIWIGLAFFIAALAWSNAVSFADSNGATIGASPWYAQGLLAPVLVLFAHSAPRWLAALQTLIWFWIFTLTWVAKLIPWYGGYRGRATLPALWHWYTSSRDTTEPLQGILSTTALLPPHALAVLLSVALLTGVLLTVWVDAGRTQHPPET